MRLRKNFYSGNKSPWEKTLLTRIVQDSLVNENILTSLFYLAVITKIRLPSRAVFFKNQN